MSVVQRWLARAFTLSLTGGAFFAAGFVLSGWTAGVIIAAIAVFAAFPHVCRADQKA